MPIAHLRYDGGSPATHDSSHFPAVMYLTQQPWTGSAAWPWCPAYAFLCERWEKWANDPGLRAWIGGRHRPEQLTKSCDRNHRLCGMLTTILTDGCAGSVFHALRRPPGRRMNSTDNFRSLWGTGTTRGSHGAVQRQGN